MRDGDKIDKIYLEIRNNVDWYQPFVAFDYDPNNNRHSVHDLSGAQMRMEIKTVTYPPTIPGRPKLPPVIGTTAVLDLKTENGFILMASLSASGEFSITVPAATLWQNMPGGVYVGDMLIFDADGTVKTLFTLELEVEQGETDPTPT